MTKRRNLIFIKMDLENLSGIANVLNVSNITHVSESPPSSPAFDFCTNSFGSSFDFPSTTLSSYRDSQTEVKRH